MTLFRRIAMALVSRPIEPRAFDGAQPLAPTPPTPARVIVAARAPDTCGHNTYYGSWLSRAVRELTSPPDPGASPWVDPYGGHD